MPYSIFCRHKQQDLINLLGATYSAVLFLGASNASSVQTVVAIERTVFYRERAAGMYSELPYAFSQVIDMTIFIYLSRIFFSRNVNGHFLLFGAAGGYRNNLCCNTNLHLFSSTLFHDRLPLEGREVLVLLLLHIHVLHVLLYVRDDGRCTDSRQSDCCRCYGILHQLLEFIFGLPHSQAGM